MNVWIWSAKTGLLLGITAFALVFVPTVIVQYRRYGRVSLGRLLGTAAVSIYIAAIASYTWLPLPPESSPAWCAAHGVDGLQLQPFAFVAEIQAEAAKVGWRAAATSHVVLQVVFNVVLFIPWGILVRGFLQRSIWTATLTGALASCIVEATQATGLWFAFPCAYRLGDVDDLITNTLGAFLGALIAPLFLFWMPRSDTLRAGRLHPRPITVLRRLLSMFITWAMVTLISGSIGIAARFALAVSGADVGPGTDPGWLPWVDLTSTLLAVVLVIYVPAIRGSGSLGQQIVWLAPRWPDRRGGSCGIGIGALWQRLARASIGGVPLILAAVLPSSSWTGLLLGVVSLLSIIMIPFTAGRRSLSGLLTGATMVDTRA